MAHDDRTRDSSFDLPQEWSRCNWLTHPAFKIMMESPNAHDLKIQIMQGQWEGVSVSLWATRAAIAHVGQPGMRDMMLECFREDVFPMEALDLWPHDNLRARFLRDEIALPYKASSGVDLPHRGWLATLARNWPWLWTKDAQKHGMGESHPLARMVRHGEEDALALLYNALTPEVWLDWSEPSADRMVALLARKISRNGLLKLIDYDPSVLAWSSKRDSRGLLHEACAKLRPDLVELLLANGLPSSQHSNHGMTPAHLALCAVIEHSRPRHQSPLKNNEIMEHLEVILNLLGATGGLVGEEQVLLDELRSDHLQRMKMIVQRALLCSVSAGELEDGQSRRL